MRKSQMQGVEFVKYKRPQKKKQSVLDKRNESLANRDLYLHPTRGLRKLNVKQSRAQQIVAEIKKGFSGWSTSKMKLYIQTGLFS